MLSEICIRRPVFAVVLSLIVVVLGVIFFNKLQIRGIPDIASPVINVTAYYGGADALYIEKEITARVEKALKTVKNLEFIRSTSEVGHSNIELFFKLSADIEVALNEVRSKISEISNKFPKDMSLPAVSKASEDKHPSIWLSVSSDQHDSLELTRITQEQIKSVLEKLPGVGEVKIHGGKHYSMLIEPDMAKMYQYKISPLEIERSIQKQNKDYPAGNIKTEGREFNVRLSGSLSKVEDFENIIVKINDQQILRLKDIAKVYLDSHDNEVILRYNGNRSMAIGVVKQSKSNIIELSDQVGAAIEKIRKTLPEAVKLDTAYDGAIPIKASIRAVFATIFEALILVVLITYLFLGSAKITIIPFVTIPISLIGTFSIMYLLGFSINTFTLLAMILAIGLVVDDAIVMVENIFRHYEAGKSAFEAAIVASKEINFAIIAMTITLSAVFLPIGFIEGFIGKLFLEFAWTLAFCVLFSGFVALTLTPMMASKMISSHSSSAPRLVKIFNHYLNLLQSKYIYYLELAFGRKKQFALFAILPVVILVVSFILVDKTLAPQEDEGFLQVIFAGPEGSSIKHSEKTVLEAEQVFSNHKDILGFFEAIGWGGGDSAFAFVPLKDWDMRTKTQEQIKNDLNRKFSQIPGMSIFAISPRSLASKGAEHAIEFNLQTSLSHQKLDKLSNDFVEKMKKVPIFENVKRDLKSSTPLLDIVVNREKAALYGVDLGEIGSTIQYLVAGKTVGDFMMGNEIYEVTLRCSKDNLSKVSDLRKIIIKNDTGFIPIETIASIVEKITVKSYHRYNNSRAVSISADLATNYKITDAIKEINHLGEELLDANTTKLEYLGEIKQMQESESNTAITFLLALIFIYLVLSAQFESFLAPLIILVAVPFSITGGVLMLVICGNSLNMYSNIGLVTLIGLVTKNSIMIVEFASQLRQQGLDAKEAIIKAANLRFRPILMTSLATIFGAIPLALASGAGSASRNSIGLVIIGGMIVGTIFTIFVIPVLYQTVNNKSVS